MGFTPAGKTPTNIRDTIQKIYNDRYNSGRAQGQQDVKDNPGEYGINGIIAKQTSGPSETLNVSDIPGFENFTVNNFAFQIIAPAGTDGTVMVLNHVDNYNTSLGGGYVVKKHYNSNTGIFTGAVIGKTILQFNIGNNITWSTLMENGSKKIDYKIPAKIALIL